MLQRVSRAAVRVDGRVRGEIGAGAVILLGVGRADQAESARALAQKIAHLRIFSGGAADGAGQAEAIGDAGAVEDVGEGEGVEGPGRAGFQVGGRIGALGVPVETGVFQAHMEVELVGDGPVTLLLDSDKMF